MKSMFSAVLFLLLFSCGVKKESHSLLFHSHNDYLQEKPFANAYKAKFKSIEVDIFRKGDSLYVAHNYEDIKQGNTLQNLYLNPLKSALDSAEASYKPQPIYLLVDIKRNGEKVYPLLDSILSNYNDILMKYENGDVKDNSVQVIISGDRPFKKIHNAKRRYVFLDGRLKQLNEDNFSNNFIPLYSDNWHSFFKWDGIGEMPTQDFYLLESLAKKAKLKKSYLRFWNTPNKTYEQRMNFYDALSKYDNIIIGTDYINEAVDYSNQL